MNLHRANKKADWDDIPPSERNVFQRIAAKTDGTVTPGNVVSVAGAATVASGLKDIYKGKTSRGVVKVGIGRIGDLIDGTVADKTGTKGPKGEATDAGIDKALMMTALPVLVKKGGLPKYAAGALVVQNVASAGIAAQAKQEGVELHPSEAGKKAVFGQWGAVGLYGLAEVARRADSPNIARGLEVAGLATLAVASALGTKAVIDYHAEVQAGPPNPQIEQSSNTADQPPTDSNPPNTDF